MCPLFVYSPEGGKKCKRKKEKEKRKKKEKRKNHHIHSRDSGTTSTTLTYFSSSFNASRAPPIFTPKSLC